jgi:hypothetical protein
MLFFFHKWGGFVVKELIFIFGVQGSILMNGMGCDQRWNVNHIFLTYIGNIGWVLIR